MAVVGGNRIFTGRNIITTSVDVVNPFPTHEALLGELSRVMPMHFENAKDIAYLQDYYKGYHKPILTREKSIRPDINNNIVINYAGSATRDIVSYFLGKSITYVPRKGENRELVQNLTDALSAENKDTVDIEIATNLSICGLGYRGTYFDEHKTNGYSIKMVSHDPLNTFVVHSANRSERPPYCVDFYIAPDTNGDEIKSQAIFTVFTRSKRYTITVDDIYAQTLVLNAPIDFSGATIVEQDYSFGGSLPITEYINNQWRMGDWESAVGLMDAIDLAASDAVNEIEQYVSSMLLVIGAEVTEDVKNKIEQLKLVNITDVPDGKQVSVEYLTNELKSADTQILREYLESSLRVVIGVPDRKTRGGGGGDTGDAVFMRDGWQDIDLVAAFKEQFFRRSDRSALEGILYILNTTGELGSGGETSLKANDIDIKFTRTKTANLMTKAQSYAILVGAGIDPTDALDMVDITTDVLEVIQRSEEYLLWKAKLDKKVSDITTPEQLKSPDDKGFEDNNGRSDDETANLEKKPTDK